MATRQQCEEALTSVATKLGQADEAATSKLDDRTLSCTVTDLGLVYRGRLSAGQLRDVALDEASDAAGAAQAQLRLALSSDDLVALARGELDFAKAWLSGRVKLQASFSDLLRLRALL